MRRLERFRRWCSALAVGRICNPSGRFAKPSYRVRYSNLESALGAWRIAVLLLPLLLLAGCKKKPATTQAANPPAPTVPDSTRPPIGNYVPAAGRLVPEHDLGQFAKMYLADAIGNPPRSLADMPEVRRDMSKAYPAFVDGRYVVAWGADPNLAPAGASQTVLAYEKATPEKGGIVAFLDGSVRNVTAQEFQTFAKPGAK